MPTKGRQQATRIQQAIARDFIARGYISGVILLFSFSLMMVCLGDVAYSNII